MSDTFNISFYFDTRSAKVNGLYPLKIRVYSKLEKKQKLFNTGIDITISEYDQITTGQRLKPNVKELKQKTTMIIANAIELASTLTPFTLARYSRMYKEPTKTETLLIPEIKGIVKEKLMFNAYSTAEKYELTHKAILRFREDAELLTIYDIDKLFLQSFEQFIVGQEGSSMATAGIYLRNIRHAYRRVLERSGLDSAYYPFGNAKHQFQIKSVSKTNKALSEAEKNMIESGLPKNDNQELAKDIWLFSYYSYGINLRDILELKVSEIHENYFTFIRHKTKNTKKNIVQKRVLLGDFQKKIIEKYLKPGSIYLFDVLKPGMNSEVKHKAVKSFNKFVNHNMKCYCSHIGLRIDISKSIAMNHARHTFATVASKKGAPLTLVSEILHDGNLKTTQEYLGSFTEKEYDDLSKLL